MVKNISANEYEIYNKYMTIKLQCRFYKSMVAQHLDHTATCSSTSNMWSGVEHVHYSNENVRDVKCEQVVSLHCFYVVRL